MEFKEKLISSYLAFEEDMDLSDSVHDTRAEAGSTRMKSGTAQKMVLNMISTSAMILLGKVQGNKMVDMQLSNDKLIARGTRMIVESTKVTLEYAEMMLLKHGSVRAAVHEIQSTHEQE